MGITSLYAEIRTLYFFIRSEKIGEMIRAFLEKTVRYNVIPRDLETTSIYVHFVTRTMLRIIYVTYIMFTVMLWRDTSHLAKILLQ